MKEIATTMSPEALQELPVGVFWFDKDGKFFEVNKTACKTWGYTREEFLKLKIFDINTQMKKEKWDAHWIKKQNDPSTFEGMHQRKNGETFHVSITDIFVKFKGEVYGCAIITDISEKKEADKKARLSDFTVQKAGDAIMWISPDGHIKHVNNAAIVRYGYTQDEFIGMSILSISKEADQEKFNNIWKTLKEQKLLQFEANHYSKDGTKIEVDISTHYVKFENTEYACTMIRDIRDRKRKESALRGALLEIKDLKKKLEAENNYLHQEINVQNNFGEIISSSLTFKKVLQQIEQVSNTSSTVLVTGESGTGKELIARAIHQLSKRNIKPMIKVNCAALPPNLIESELFGHEKGAFTGAVEKKIGKFDLADGGTLFLDEIGEMPIELQPKLLRAIQEGEIESVGSNETHKVNVRIIAATNKILAEEVSEGNFREDLFYRLNVFPIHSPPLRDRREDIPLLIRYFCEKIGTKLGRKITNIPQKVISALSDYDFPGNVRELENLIERGIIMSKGNKLNLGDWFNPKTKKKISKKILSLEEMQRNHIIKALQYTNWKVSGKNGAAELLKMRPTTLYSKIEKLNIKRSIEVTQT